MWWIGGLDVQDLFLVLFSFEVAPLVLCHSCSCGFIRMSWWVVFLVTEMYLATGFIVCHSGCVFGLTYHYASDVCWPSQVSKVMPPGLYASLSYLLIEVLKTWLNIEEIPCFSLWKRCLVPVWIPSVKSWLAYGKNLTICRVFDKSNLLFAVFYSACTYVGGISGKGCKTLTRWLFPHCWHTWLWVAASGTAEKFRSCIPTIQPSAFSTISLEISRKHTQPPYIWL